MELHDLDTRFAAVLNDEVWMLVILKACGDATTAQVLHRSAPFPLCLPRHCAPA
jgi:hypothetical protein